MAVSDFSGLTINKPQVGIQITKVTDSSADWPSVANSTYFYDKTDTLVHYKDSTGTVLEIFSAPGVATNIYTADGTLGGNRVVTMSTNTINFSGGNFGINSAAFDGTNPERLLVAPSNQINAIVAKGSVNSYMQLNIKNTSNGNSSSSDVVATSNNGTELVNYIDMGINGGNYGAGFIGVANDCYLYGAGREMFIGNTNTASTGNLKFFAGNSATTIGMTLTYQSRLGIGITAPTAKVHITNTDAINSLLVEDATNPDSTPFVIDQNGNVAIGATSATEKLEVSGKTKTTTFQLTTGAATNSYLASDASGNGTWTALPAQIQAAASDETTNLTTGTAKITFRMPHAMTLTAVRASLSTAQTAGALLTVDINLNGVSVLGTKLTFDNTEKTTVTATTPATIVTSALTDDGEITVDIDTVGTAGAKGLKITLIGTRA
jgi:hypothetical protein